MAGDEQLRIDVEVVGGKEAVETLGKLSDKVKEATDLISKSGWGNKELKTLSKEFNSITQSMSAYSKAIDNVNKTNTKALLNEEKLAQARAKTELQLARTKAGLDKISESAKRSTSILNQFNFSIKVMIGNLGSTVISKAAASMKEFAASISRAGIELDALNNTMLAATGGWESGGREINWVIDMSNRLGLSFRDVSDSYAKFMTSFTRSGGTINQSRQIFEDLSTAMVSLHLPAERMQGVFIALEQMANKGTVQAEELKRQLGNALPGAFELAAESMGILPSKLMDMMKKGEVFSKDFLPAFAATVKQALGQSIDIASVQFNASLGRLMTNLDLFRMNVGQILNDTLLPLVNGLVSLTGVLANSAKSLNENRTALNLFAGAMAGLAVTVTMIKWDSIVASIAMLGQKVIAMIPNLKTTIEGWKLIAKGMSLAKIEMVGLIAESIALNIATAGIPILIGAIVAGCTALSLSLRNASREASNITPYVGLSQQITTATKEVTALNEQLRTGQIDQKDYAEQTQKYKEQFPELIGYLEKTGKNFKDLTQDELNNIAALGELDAKQRIATEKTKELNSWQATLSATFRVVWNDIKKVVSTAVDWIADKFSWLINMHKAVISTISGAFSSLANNFSTWFKGTEFGAKVIDEKIKTATENERKKLEVVEKNMKIAASTLKSAQATASGLVSGGDSKDKKSKSAKIKEADTEWDKLNKLVSKQREQLLVLELQHKEDKKLEEDYKSNSKRLEDARKKVEALTKAEKEQKFQASENAKLWDKITKSAKDAAKSYEAMTFNSQNYSSSEIEQARQLSKNYNALVKYSEALKANDNMLKITSRTARDLTNTLVDGLFEPLKEGESIWSRFADAGRSAIKSIATEWVKNKMNLILTGAQAGWGVGTLGEGTFGQKAQFAGVGAMQGLLGKPLFGTKYNNPFAKAAEGDDALGSVLQTFIKKIGAENVQDSVFTELANQAVGLGNVISSNATLAVSSLANALTSSGGAGAGMTVLAGTANVAATAFTSAAPALMAMATALNAISTSAATAATSMAALAVSTAAESVAKIPFVGGFLAPVAALATGAAIGAGAAMTGAGIAAGATMAGGGQMLGGAMSGLGSKVSNWGTTSKVIPHAKGGIVSSPTMFPMQGGNVGVAGEAGTEVIAPARRMSNGDLGIGAVQPQVTVNNYTNAAVEVIKRPDNEMEIKITELNAMLSSSRTNRGMASAQSRMSSQGRRIG